MAHAPLAEQDGGSFNSDLPDGKREYFSSEGLTSFLKFPSDLPVGLFCRRTFQLPLQVNQCTARESAALRKTGYGSLRSRGSRTGFIFLNFTLWPSACRVAI